jgi:hypothetical protein
MGGDGSRFFHLYILVLEVNHEAVTVHYPFTFVLFLHCGTSPEPNVFAEAVAVVTACEARRIRQATVFLAQ